MLKLNFLSLKEMRSEESPDPHQEPQGWRPSNTAVPNQTHRTSIPVTAAVSTSPPERAGGLRRIILTVPPLGLNLAILLDIYTGFSDSLRLSLLMLSLGAIFLLWRKKLRLLVSNTTRPAGAGLRGEVRGFQERAQDSRGGRRIFVWNFRIERYQDGQRLPPIPVEMTGKRFHGFVKDGDNVEVSGKWQPGKLMKVKKIYNWTNGMKVRVKRITVRIILWMVFIGSILSWFVIRFIARVFYL